MAALIFFARLALIGLVILPVVVSGGEGYNAITGPCGLEFPKDHGAHPGFRTEWWYYTGNLSAESGERFGFQLTFFRSQLMPSAAVGRWPHPASAWRSNQIYLAHAALTDISGRKFRHHERTMRQALGLAGVVQKGSQTALFIRDWSIRIEPRRHQLRAKTESFHLDFTLVPQKPPVRHGDSGYSRKGRTSERASCYYSFTRLQTEGVISDGKRDYRVTGESWMDHEFSSSPLEPGLVGWDWFSLQLSDQTEIMIYLMRAKGGGFSPASSGTYVDAAGLPRHLLFEDFTLHALNAWRSPSSGGSYPSRWRLSVPSCGLLLTIEPNMVNQELQTQASTNVTYWEGSVSAHGQKDHKPLKGSGYVELTGYAEAFKAPM
jgi:predicted secreted hydrolase